MKFELLKISEIESYQYDGEVYDLEVEEDHSYNIDGIIVHNSDFVMLGGMFSGTDECEGEWTLNENGEKRTLQFYGMSSKEAQDKHNGGLKDYRASEGKCVQVEYKGPVDDIVQNIKGGLASACCYVGAEKLKHLSKCCTFIRVNRTHNKIFG